MPRSETLNRTTTAAPASSGRMPPPVDSVDVVRVQARLRLGVRIVTIAGKCRRFIPSILRTGGQPQLVSSERLDDTHNYSSLLFALLNPPRP